MGRIGLVLSWFAEAGQAPQVKADPGGGDNVTFDHYAPPGDDSQPLPGDYVAGAQTGSSGAIPASGYYAPSVTPKAAPGDKRIFARSSNGAAVCEVWCRNNGSIEIASLNGGDIKLGQVTIDSAGNITTPGDVLAGPAGTGVSLRGHWHGYFSDPAVPGKTTLPGQVQEV